ncbi:uncharacterized protein E0L32_004712 [Thyridium curvatum]|uniref:Association with the SNF1 complex (ASC) domain-containing protein n=1 Tax=Thyridium curvatum TaxID=1093900 RepID=A0A507B960_9PEZI|nr:uncharacterized protein E0L32_004712 [Thyridium curvatum]TPX15154.1 hypothetical protein E0L32_004712 [Thyridium curvatum]
MGNSPSTSKPATPVPGSSHDGHRPPKRDTKHPIHVHHHRSAAPPEQSLAQATGSTVTSASSSVSSKHKTLPLQPALGSSPASGTQNNGNAAAKQQQPKTAPIDTAPSKPVAVPNPHGQSSHQASAAQSEEAAAAAAYVESMDAAGMMPHNSMQDMSYLSRPPRMPLPIEEEIHTPGSPIIAATDIGPPLEDDEAIHNLDAADLTRKSSALSTTTVDEEDAEELRVDKSRPTVPTRLEWLRGGDKVYVTGTIFQWNRKQRLHPVNGRPGAFAGTVNVLPGTHHIRFLVDGQMQTSPDLPTTVDFGNNLVNYIEVSPDDVPGVTADAAAATPTDEKAGLTKPEPSQEDEKTRAPKNKPITPISEFSHHIPKYLVDFDQPEDSPQYQSAVGAIEKLPPPPSLPGFLGKPILNAAVLIKDDNSVLNMPNHTVLNHLATSSIKNNTLAVSVTTRYKNKYVTTIIHKPTDAPH